MAKEQLSKMILPKVDDLFSTQQTRDDAKLERVKIINISDIDDFPEHPFKVLENDDMLKMCESIKDNGVLVPALVRPKENGRYEMISGHRRKRASELCGLETIPCIVRDLSLEEATIIMVDSNMQREEILPSEKAFAYKMKLEAINHQGKTFGQVGQKSHSRDSLSENTQESSRQIHRYIRLTELIPKILDMVDNKKIAFNPAVEISYLKKDEQEKLYDSMEKYQATPSQQQAIEMKKLSQSGDLTFDKIEGYMIETKPNQTPKLKVSMNRLSTILPRTLMKDSEKEEYVIKAVEFYVEYQKRLKQKRQEQGR